MNVELADVEIPQYPSGSYNFIRRLRNVDELHYEHAKFSNPPLSSGSKATNGTHEAADQPWLKLDVAVIGAGVGGLATAIALRQCGHNVSVYEQAPALGEIGAGIQIPPNSTRILHSWGLQAALEDESVMPSALLWRRWEDGSVIGKATFNPESEQRFGSPYYVTHRAYPHKVLHHKAVKLGTLIHLNKKVHKYGLDDGTVTFEDGIVVSADLIVAADGLKSLGRRALNGKSDKGPAGHGLSAYRGTISTAEIKADPLVRWVMDKPNLNLWVGHDRHIMSYAIAGGEQYNMVITHPSNAVGPPGQPISEALDRMRAYYEGWDPSLRRLLNMLTSVVDWPINSIEIPELWTSQSGRFVLTGDAAHAMTPYMALGAAMAVEDAAALAEALKYVSLLDDLPEITSLWVQTRMPHVKDIHAASYANGLLLHLPDGLVQRKRDEAMMGDMTGEMVGESSNQWADAVFTEMAYGHDPVAEVHRAWLSGKHGNGEGKGA